MPGCVAPSCGAERPGLREPRGVPRSGELYGAGPEIRNGLGAILCAARFKPGSGRTLFLRTPSPENEGCARQWTCAKLRECSVVVCCGSSLTLKRSPLLTFESSAFAPMAGEDRETNPGIFGKALALWIAEQLGTAGFVTGDVVAEDFGWCVPVESKPHSLYVACASTDESATHWGVFVFAEGSLLARLLGKDKRAESVASLFSAVHRCLADAHGVRALREEPLPASHDL